MADAFVQKLGSAFIASGQDAVITVTGTTTAGNHIIVGATNSSAGVTVTCTDSAGNTYQNDLANVHSTGPWINVLSSHTTGALSTGVGTIDVHFSSTVANAEVFAYEFSGLATSAWLDKTAGSATTASGTSASSTSTTTTAQADELLFGMIAWSSSTGSSAHNLTLLDEVDAFATSHSCLTQYSLVEATGTYAATATIPNVSYNAVIVTYKASGSSPPTNTVAPAVTGTATVGSVLTTTNGTWTDDGSPTFTYQWQRDVAGNGVYSNISSATSSTYTLVSADDTCHVRCVVTDTDSIGNTSANSNATAIVTFAIPVNSVAPTVSGNTVVGSVLSATTGTWSNSPTSYGYQWTRDGVNISAATSSTYTSVSADATHAVGCKVTATNDGGTASAVASSNTISVVTAPSLSTVVGKTGTSGTAVMQKAGSGYTYITGKTGTSGTAVDQKGAGSFTKIKGH